MHGVPDRDYVFAIYYLTEIRRKIAYLWYIRPVSLGRAALLL